MNCMLSEPQKKILEQARNTYGISKQIFVSTEELCELAAVCAKFPRYEDPSKAREELHQKALDEVADVLIVMDHIVNIFGLQEAEVSSRIAGKMDRLSRWLSVSDSMEQTTVDREVHEEKGSHVPCGKCKHFGNFQNIRPGHRCVVCVQHPYEQFEPKESENNADDS